MRKPFLIIAFLLVIIVCVIDYSMSVSSLDLTNETSQGPIYYDGGDSSPAKFTADNLWGGMGLINSKGERSIHIGPTQKPHSYKALVPFLSDADDGIKSSAINWLSALGSDAKPALPELRKCLLDTNPTIVKEVTAAIRTIDKSN